MTDHNAKGPHNHEPSVCGVCKNTLEGIVTCPRCLAPIHADCAEFVGEDTCPTMYCTPDSSRSSQNPRSIQTSPAKDKPVKDPDKALIAYQETLGRVKDYGITFEPVSKPGFLSRFLSFHIETIWGSNQFPPDFHPDRFFKDDKTEDLRSDILSIYDPIAGCMDEELEKVLCALVCPPPEGFASVYSSLHLGVAAYHKIHPHYSNWENTKNPLLKARALRRAFSSIPNKRGVPTHEWESFWNQSYAQVVKDLWSVGRFDDALKIAEESTDLALARKIHFAVGIKMLGHNDYKSAWEHFFKAQSYDRAFETALMLGKQPRAEDWEQQNDASFLFENVYPAHASIVQEPKPVNQFLLYRTLVTSIAPYNENVRRPYQEELSNRRIILYRDLTQANDLVGLLDLAHRVNDMSKVMEISDALAAFTRNAKDLSQ